MKLTSLTPGLSPVESVQKSSTVVRPKDSAALLNWKETTGANVEESRSSFQEETAFNDQTHYSYQQISCLDSVVRYRRYKHTMLNIDKNHIYTVKDPARQIFKYAKKYSKKKN